jgi:hypothetical protein
MLKKLMAQYLNQEKELTRTLKLMLMRELEILLNGMINMRTSLN